MPSPTLQRRGVNSTSKFAFRRAKSHIGPSPSSSLSSILPSRNLRPSSSSSSARLIPGISSAPSSPRPSPPSSFADIPYLCDNYPDIAAKAPHPAKNPANDSATVAAVAHSAPTFAAIACSTTSAFVATATQSSSISGKPAKSSNFRPNILTSSPSSSSSSSTSPSFSTYYNTSFKDDDWTKQLVESPFEDDADTDAEADVPTKMVFHDDDDGVETTVPWESRMLRIVSGLIVLFVVVVVVFAGLGGVNSFPASRELVVMERLLEKQIVKQQREKDAPPIKILNIITQSRKEAGLELAKRKKLEQKLEDSIAKRNRILDILLKQQHQQMSIMNRQKEILLILDKNKRR